MTATTTDPFAASDSTAIRLGRQVCGDLDQAAAREWLVTDGLGGFAMGTAAGLRTRRYHGLLVVATAPPIGRQLGLVSLDAVVVIGDRRVQLATHQWVGGAVAPTGHRLLASFALIDGVPVWRWDLGDVIIERELAMTHGRSAVGIVHRVVRAPGPVRIELEALCTWRNVHSERGASGSPAVTAVDGGFVFEDAYRVRGAGYVAGGDWYRGVFHRLEAERGLNASEDLWFAGRFVAELHAGESTGVEAWAQPLDDAPAGATEIVAAARQRAHDVAARAGTTTATDALLAHAADQLIVAGPTVVAGYPWFGDWSRDTMTSYEGLFLDTGRADEGRALLLAAGASISEGMLANTADVGGTQFNTVDASPWFLHVVGRHIERTGDVDLGAQLAPALASIVEHYRKGTRFGIRVDEHDGLVTQGEAGVALTWMDARVDGVPITARQGKPIEVNALWVRGVGALAELEARLHLADAAGTAALAATARASLAARFVHEGGCFDVIDGPDGDDRSVRPNQLLAAALLPAVVDAAAVVRACAPLLTSVGLRSLDPADSRYIGAHRGGSAERDRAYHQGTVWPWLIGAYVEACRHASIDVTGVLDGLTGHLGEWGLGSVSETLDGEAPHGGTGCPFQAWSVAELNRARRLDATTTH